MALYHTIEILVDVQCQSPLVPDSLLEMSGHSEEGSKCSNTTQFSLRRTPLKRHRNTPSQLVSPLQLAGITHAMVIRSLACSGETYLVV